MLPGGVIAYGDVVGVQVLGEDRHELCNARMDVGKTGLGQIAQKSKRTLTNFGHWILDKKIHVNKQSIP